MNAFRAVRAAGVMATTAVAVLGVQSTAQASVPTLVYVSADNQSGTGPCLHTAVHSIQDGVDQVAPGGTVVVCSGTYHESVDISKMLELQGQKDATVDATGRAYGIGIGADHVTVTGMTVKNAGVDGPAGGPGDGIVTAVLSGAAPVVGNYATITGNVLSGNTFGIDVNSTRESLVRNNRATGNGVGINVVDDFGKPTQNNKIIGNTTNDNLNGCGIAVASHTGAGAIGNLVLDNTANGNGTGPGPGNGVPPGGAGILLATPTSGATVRDNKLIGNTANGNSHAGIEVHIHPTGVNASGNLVVDNTIGTNNSHGDSGDPDTTGIYIGSNSPMTIALRNNHISDDVNGVFQAGTVTLKRSATTFTDVQHQYVSTPVYAG